jgi:prevent-host-death family protein
MGIVSISEAKISFSKFINRAAYGRERIVVTSHGEPRAAIISIDDLNRLEVLEEEQDAAMLAQAIATETEFYSVSEVEAELARLESTE